MRILLFGGLIFYMWGGCWRIGERCLFCVGCFLHVEGDESDAAALCVRRDSWLLRGVDLLCVERWLLFFHGGGVLGFFVVVFCTVGAWVVGAFDFL